MRRIYEIQRRQPSRFVEGMQKGGRESALSQEVGIVRSAMGCWMRKRRTWFCGGGGQEDADWKAVHLDLNWALALVEERD